MKTTDTHYKSGRRRAHHGRTARVFALSIIIPLAAISCATSTAARDGDGCFNQGQYERAVEQYRIALAENPGSLELRAKLQLALEKAAEERFHRGTRLLRKNRLRDAAREFDAAVNIRPDYEKAKKTLDSTQRLIRRITVDTRQGGRLVSEKNWFEAIKVLEKHDKYAADFPDLERFLGAAVEGAFASLMDEGIAAYRAKKFGDALATFRHAEKLKPRDGGAAKMAEASRRQVLALRDCREAAARLEAGDFRGAIEYYEYALIRVPGHSVALEGLARAKDFGSKELFERGRAALKNGKFATATAALNEAMEYAPDLKGLAKTATKARRSLGTILYERGTRRERIKAHALAYINFKMAQEVCPELPGLKAALIMSESEIEKRRSYNVFFTASGEQDNMKERVLAGASGLLKNTGAAIFGPETARFIIRRNPNFIPDGVLALSFGQPSISLSTPTVETKSKRYIRGTRIVMYPGDRPYPPYHGPRRAHGNYDNHRPPAADTGRLPPDPLHHRPRFRRHPRYVRVLDYATYDYDIITKKITGRITATYRLVDTLSGEELFCGTAAAKHSDTDTVVEGNSRAGVEIDPDELMSKEEMRDDLQDKIVRRLSSALGREIRKYPERFLLLAKKEKAVGNTGLWLDCIALYILTGGGDSSLRAEIDSILRRDTGYSLLSRRIDYGAIGTILGEDAQ